MNRAIRGGLAAFAALATMGLLASCTASDESPAPESSVAPASFEGTWGDTERNFITFHSDGSLVGHDGCNGIRGTYETIDGTASVTLGLSTLKGCIGVDTWLRGIDSATIEDDQLIVFDREQTRIGELSRAE